jgi:hypothetical protein
MKFILLYTGYGRSRYPTRKRQHILICRYFAFIARKRHQRAHLKRQLGSVEIALEMALQMERQNAERILKDSAMP